MAIERKEAISRDVEHLIAGQEALAHFGRYAFAADNLDAILSAACEQVARGLGVPMAKIAVTLPGTDTMLLKAAVGIPASAGVPGVTQVPGGKGSSMGYALLFGEPIVSTVETETRFQPSDVVRKSGVRSSANVVIWTADSPFGVLEADSPEPDVFGEHDIHFLQLYANLVGAAVERQKLAARAKDLVRQRELLLKESVHRIKNVLAMVQAIARRTQKDAKSLDEFAEAFNGRLGALARLQDSLLLKGRDSVSFAELARSEIGVSGATEGKQFVLRGPDLICAPSTVQPLSLLFYELTTNACKYGSLSASASDAAAIEVLWSIEHLKDSRRQLEVHWREHIKNAEIKAKAVGARHGGFGSELINEAIPRMLDGTAEVSIRETGFNFVLRFPIKEVHEY